MNKEVKEIVANYTSARKTLQKLVPDFTWSELLGDYGEYVCIVRAMVLGRHQQTPKALMQEDVRIRKRFR